MIAWALMSSIVLGVGGCQQSLQGPDLGGLYDRAAMSHEADRNPVIVIPGILGSRLVSPEGQLVWGSFGGGAAHPSDPEGMRQIALPMRSGTPLAQLTDGISPDGALDRVRFSLLFVPVQVRAYADILAVLGVGGYRDQGLAKAGAVDYGTEHFTCFQFSYDWRRDNVENAQRLGAFIEDRKAYVEAQLKQRYGIERDVKFDLVAHSMGGLVARWWLRYGNAELTADGALPEVTWAGAEHVGRVILVGTPSLGSAAAIEDMVEGSKLAPILPRYDPVLLGTMPAIYQLLPRDRHGALEIKADPDGLAPALLDPQTWRDLGWGLASPRADRVLQHLLPDVETAAERRTIALAHLDQCLARADRFQRALDTPATRPAGLEMHLFAGDAVATASTARVDSPTRITLTNPVPGDGTVTRISALADERLPTRWMARLTSPIDWSHVTFLFDDHIGLTKSQVFADNLLYLLLEAPQQ